MDQVLLRMVRLFKGIFLRQGVDFERMMAIVQNKLLMDKRRVHMNWKQGRQKERTNHLRVILLSYLFFGLLFGFFIFVVPSFMISMILMHAYILFMMAMTLITDFSTVLLDTADNQIILPRPVSGKTLFMARMVHIFVYLLQFTTALVLCPLVFMSIKYGILTGAGFILTALFTVLLAVCLTYILYLLILRFSSEERVKEIVTYFQIFMTIFFVAGYQVIPRIMDLKQLSADFSFFWYSYLLPPVWMSVALESIHTGRWDLLHILMIALTILVPIIAFWFLNKYLAPSFARKLSVMQTSAADRTNKRKGSTQPGQVSLLSRMLCRNSPEQVAFEITWKITGRDKGFRLQFYPSLAYILIFIFIFIFNSGRDMASSWQALPDSNRFLWFIYLPMFTISSSIIIVSFNENYQASWIYHSLPIARPGELVLGSIKALFAKYFLPSYFIVFGICFYIWGSAILDDFTFGLFNNLLCFLIFANLSEHYLPFSRQPNTRQQMGRFLIVLFQMILVAGLVGIHYLILQQGWLMAVLVPLLIVGCIVLMRRLQQLPWNKISI